MYNCFAGFDSQALTQRAASALVAKGRMAKIVKDRKRRRKVRRAKHIEGKLVLDSYKLRNIVNIKAGDFIVIRPPVHQPDYFAKIEAVVRDPSGKVQVLITWLYRPENTLDGYGRLPYHGRDELFLSNHEDCVDVDTVERKCNVLTLYKYQKMKKVGPDYDTYFARYFYEVELQNIKPISKQRLQIQCLCMLPSNPDRMMISCDRCLKMFHPECVGLSMANRQMMIKYLCLNCKYFLSNVHVGSPGVGSCSPVIKRR